MVAGCLFDFAFEFLEVCKHIALLPHVKDPCMPREVVDEGNIVPPSVECGCTKRGTPMLRDDG